MDFIADGRTVDCRPAEDEPLLWTLRDRLHLKGTKYGCCVGACGICTILIDGERILRSEAPPGGIGECAVPPVAPAAANACIAATGQRLRRLPLAGYSHAPP